MSQFSLPRIYFRGKAIVNAPTGNNQPELCDPVNVRLATKSRKPSTADDSPTTRGQRDRLVRFGERLAYPEYPVDPSDPSPPRDHWNYYGDFRFWFEDVTVHQVTLEDRILRNRRDDPVIGANVSLINSVMVDVDPLAIITSQVFAESLLFTNRELLLDAKPVPHFARWFNAVRVLDPSDRLRGGAAIFQAQVHRPPELVDSPSPALTELLHAARGKLFLQYTLFNGRRPLRSERVADEFLHGRHVTNPCQLNVEGTISPMEPDDLQTLSPARCLLEDDSRQNGRLGPAFVRVDPLKRRLMLDLSVTLALDPRETEPRQSKLPARSLQLVAPNRAVKRFDARLSSYQQNGGILDRRLTKRDVQAFTASGLEIRVTDEAGQERILRELPLSLQCDQRAIYVEQQGSSTFTIHGRKGASKLRRSLKIRLAVVPSAMSKAKAVNVVTLSGPTVRRVGDGRYTATLDPNGLAVQVRGVRAGAVHVLFGASTGMPAKLHQLTVTSAESGGVPADDAFLTVRVLPRHRAAKVVPPFPVIYDEILRYYDVIFPYMTDRHFQFDETDLRTNARQILARLQLGTDHPNHMPPSRDMSRGKRAVLVNYLERLLEESSVTR